jgi:hypothetical protein
MTNLIIDERHSKGLANQFFNYFSEDANHNLKNRFSSKKKLKDRNSFDGFVKDFKSYNKNYSLNSMVTGSKRNPFLIFNLLLPHKKRAFNTWNERSLSSYVYMENIRQYYWNRSTYIQCEQNFSISEHAISRIFLRSGLAEAFGKDNYFVILNEMKFVCLWASFWSALLYNINDINENIDDDKKKKIKVLIPAPNGIYLGYIVHEEAHHLEIRTYLNNKDLAQPQLKLRQIFIDISLGLENSPLSFYPLKFHGMNNYGCTFPFNLILWKLKNHIDLISEVFYEKSIRDKEATSFEVYELSKSLNAFIKYIEINEIENDLAMQDADLKKLSMQEFLFNYCALN